MPRLLMLPASNRKDQGRKKRRKTLSRLKNSAMVKAGSLFYTLAIALLIGMVSSSLILFSYFNTLGFHMYLNMERLRVNAGSGLNLLLSEQELAPKGEAAVIDLYGHGTDSVQLQKKAWGACEVAIARAFSGNRQVLQVAQVGYGLIQHEQLALYL